MHLIRYYTFNILFTVYENVPPRPQRTMHNIQDTYANESLILPTYNELEKASNIYANKPSVRRQTNWQEPASCEEVPPPRPPRDWSHDRTESRSQDWTQPSGRVYEEVPPQRSQHTLNPSSGLRRDDVSPSRSRRGLEHFSGSTYEDKRQQSQHIEQHSMKRPLIKTTLHGLLQEDAKMFETYKDK